MKPCTAFLLVLASNFPAYACAQSLSETAPLIEQAAPVVAEVILNLEHSPTDEQMARLQEISSNEAESNEIRTIATAVMHFEHAVHPDYLDDLEAIRDNEYATAREKTLADVLLDMRHRPDAEQTGRLAEVE
jgi:hypothetical protein